MTKENKETKKVDEDENAVSGTDAMKAVADAEDAILNKKFINDFLIHLRAAVPAIVVDVRDRRQFIMDVDFATKSLDFNLVTWNGDSGLSHVPAGSVQERPIGDPKETQHPMAALKIIKSIVFGAEKKYAAFSEHTVFAMRNFDECWHGMAFGQGRPFAVIEMIINCLNVFRNKTCSFLFYGPSMTIPKSLTDDVQRLSYPLPGREALLTKFKHIEESAQVKHPSLALAEEEVVDKSILSVQGLTATKAEQAFALSLIRNEFKYNEGSDYWKDCSSSRREYIREMGLVELVETHGGFDETFAGYSFIRRVIERDMMAMTPEAREFGVDKPAGFLIGGPAGTGKSALVKAAGFEYGLDVLWVSANKILDSKYGESEKRLKAILEIPELYLEAGCVLWFDECDKLFGSLTSRGDDSTSGTGLRLLSILLTYLQERNYNSNDRAYIMATFNDGFMLPDALVRPGRFNSRIWIEFPKASERYDIFSLHLKRRGKDIKDFNMDSLVEKSDGYTGAEIESVCVEGIKQAFCDGGSINDIMFDVMQGTVPQSQNDKSECHEQIAWAEQSGFLSDSNRVSDSVSEASTGQTHGLVGPAKMIEVGDLTQKKENDNTKN